MRYKGILMIAENSLEYFDEDVVKQQSPDDSHDKPVKRPATTTPMTDEQIALLEEHMEKWSCGGRSHFFGIMWRMFVKQSAAGDQFEWPPRLMTKDELILLESVRIHTKDEAILFKSLLLKLREKHEEKPAPKRAKKKAG